MTPIKEVLVEHNSNKVQPIQVLLDVVLMIPAKTSKEACEIIDTLSQEEMLTLALDQIDFLSEDLESYTLN